MSDIIQDVKDVELPEIDYDAALQFTINKDGKIYIYFHIKNASSDLETVISKFLYDLNTAQYSADILNILGRYAEEQPEVYETIKNIILKWQMIASVLTSNNNDKLVVKPTTFLRYSTQGASSS